MLGASRAALMASGGGGEVDPDYASVSLLLDFEGADAATATTDGGPVGHTVTFNGNAQIDTARAATGVSSVLFDGTGDYLTVADHASLQLSADFTIEFDFYPEAGETSAGVLYIQDSGSYAAQAFYFDGTTLDFYSSSSPSGSWDIASAIRVASSLSTDAWSGHVAVTRSGSTYRTYAGGSKVSEFTSSATPLSGYSTGIGARPNGSQPLDGSMDRLRITKGVARYTGSTLVIPTDLYPTR
jgi:hypothetical protein